MIIKNQPVCRIIGKPFMLPQYDAADNLIILDGKLVSMPTADLAEVLKFFILRGIPRDKYTRVDAIHATSTYMSLVRMRDNQIELADEDYKWLVNKLNDDSCGVRMFAIDQTIIVDALRVE